MKVVLKSLILNAAFALAVWFGFIEGVQGAQYLIKFFVWAILLPVGLLGLTDWMQKSLSKSPEPSLVLRAVSRLISWASLAVFVWNGHLATAAAFGFFMLAGAISREGANQHRAAAQKA